MSKKFELKKMLYQDLDFISKTIPNVWDKVDNLRRNPPFEPFDLTQCFIPTLFCSNMVLKGKSVEETPDFMIYFMPRVIATLSAWRMTQGIYRFDSTLHSAISNSEGLKNLSHSCFENFPEWCIYIEMPNYKLINQDVIGFFCRLDQVDENKNIDLSLLFKTITPKGFGFTPIDVPLDSKTDIDEAVHISLSAAFTLSERYKSNKKSLFADGKPIELDFDISNDNCYKTVKDAISLVTYICSKKPDYSGSQPSFPKPVKTKKGLRFFPPDKPKIIEIGKTIGEKLRQHEAAQEKQYIESGATKRPHIRRGHWHGVWTGARNSETPQTFKYNWIPPIGVNIEGGI